MNATTKVKLREITPNLTCHLCKGYFIDATTIIECLHSFCKSCIVKHLEKSEYCPVCDVQLHSSKPLSSIRSDQMLQEIVYKLVPGLFQNEMENRRRFYKENQDSKPVNQMDSGHVYNESYISSDDIIHLSLEYHTTDTEFRDSTKRFIKCPAAVSIAILKKLLQGKFDLTNEATIEVMYGERVLPDDFLLMDIAYKYSWTQNGKPLQLCYRVKGDASMFKTVSIQKYEDEDSEHSHGLLGSAVAEPITAQNEKHISQLPVKTNEASKTLLNGGLPLLNTAPSTAKRRQSRGTKANTGGKNEDENAINAKSKKLTNGLIHNSSEPKALNSKSKVHPARKSLPATILDLNLQSGMPMEIDVTPVPLRGRPKRKSLGTAEEKNNDLTNSTKRPAKTRRKSVKDTKATALEINDKEVQLRISENGVICARNASGEEKIIGVKGSKGPSSASLNNSVSLSNSEPSLTLENKPPTNLSNGILKNQHHSHHLMIPQIAANHIMGLNSPTSHGSSTTHQSPSDYKGANPNSANVHQHFEGKGDKKVKTKSPRLSACKGNKRNSSNTNGFPGIATSGQQRRGAAGPELNSKSDAEKSSLVRIGTKRKLPAQPLKSTLPKTSKSKLAEHFGTSITKNRLSKKNSNMETLKSVTRRLQDELDAQVSYFAAEITPIITPTNSSASSLILSQNQSQPQQNTVNTSDSSGLSNLGVKSAEIQVQNFPGASLPSLFGNKLNATTGIAQIPPGPADKRQQKQPSSMLSDVNAKTKYSMLAKTPTKQLISPTTTGPSGMSSSKVKILPKLPGKESPIQQQKLLLSSSSSPSSSPKKPPKFFKSRHTNSSGVGVQSDLPLSDSASKSSKNMALNLNVNPSLNTNPSTTRLGYVGVGSDSLENTTQKHMGCSPLVNGTISSSIIKTPPKALTNDNGLGGVPVQGPIVTSSVSISPPSMSLSSTGHNVMTLNDDMAAKLQQQHNPPHMLSVPHNSSMVTTSSASPSSIGSIQGHIIAQSPSQGQVQAQPSYRFPVSMGMNMNMNFPNGIPMSLVPFVTSSYHQPYFSTSLTPTSSTVVGVNAAGSSGQKNISVPSIFAHPYFDFSNPAQIQSFAQNVNAMNIMNNMNMSVNGNLNNLNILNAYPSTSTHNIQDLSFTKLNSSGSGESTTSTSSSVPFSSYSHVLTSQPHQQQQPQITTSVYSNNNNNTNAQVQIPVPSTISSLLLPAVSSRSNNEHTSNTIIISNPTNAAKNITNSLNTSSSTINSNTITYSTCSSSSNKSTTKLKPDPAESISITDSLRAAQNLMMGIHNLGRGVNVSTTASNNNLSSINNNNKTPRKSNSPIKIGRMAATTPKGSPNVKLAAKVKTPDKLPDRPTLITSNSTFTGTGTPTKAEGGNIGGASSLTASDAGTPLASNLKSSGPVKSGSNSVAGDPAVSNSSSPTTSAPNPIIVSIYNNNDSNTEDLNKSLNPVPSTAATAPTTTSTTSSTMAAVTNNACENTVTGTGTQSSTSESSSGSNLSSAAGSTVQNDSTSASACNGPISTSSENKIERNADDAEPDVAVDTNDSGQSHSTIVSDNDNADKSGEISNENKDSSASAVATDEAVNIGNSTNNVSVDGSDLNSNTRENENKDTNVPTITSTAPSFNLNTNVNNNILPKESNANVTVGSVSVVPIPISTGAQNINNNCSGTTVVSATSVDVSVSQAENSSTPSA